MPGRSVPKLLPLINMALNIGNWQYAFIKILFIADITKR